MCKSEWIASLKKNPSYSRWTQLDSATCPTRQKPHGKKREKQVKGKVSKVEGQYVFSAKTGTRIIVPLESAWECIHAERQKDLNEGLGSFVRRFLKIYTGVLRDDLRRALCPLSVAESQQLPCIGQLPPFIPPIREEASSVTAVSPHLLEPDSCWPVGLDAARSWATYNRVVNPQLSTQQQEVVNIMTRSRRMIFIIGAGVSAAAGIPTFRTQHGLFRDREIKEAFHHSARTISATSYVNHHKVIGKLARLSIKAKPTPFHHLLAAAALQGSVQRIYSQNIDELETRLYPLHTQVPLVRNRVWPITIQLHGGLRHSKCQKCKFWHNLQPEQHITATNESLKCPNCQMASLQQPLVKMKARQCTFDGKLLPNVVLYDDAGTTNPFSEVQAEIIREDSNCMVDYLFVVGTTASLASIQDLITQLSRSPDPTKNRILVWIGLDAPPKRIASLFSLIVLEDCQAIACKLLEEFDWEIRCR